MKTQDEVAKSAEMCVIGAILIAEKALANVIQTLKPEHFYFDELKAAYQAILELSSEGCATAQDKPRSEFFRKSILETRGFSKFAESGSQFCAASGRCSKADEQEKNTENCKQQCRKTTMFLTRKRGRRRTYERAIRGGFGTTQKAIENCWRHRHTGF